MFIQKYTLTIKVIIMSVSKVTTPPNIPSAPADQAGKKQTTDTQKRADQAAQTALSTLKKEQAAQRPSCCKRFWQVLTCPFVWIYSKIAGIFAKIRDCCRDVFSDNTPIPVTEDEDIPIPLPPSDPTEDDPVPKKPDSKDTKSPKPFNKFKFTRSSPLTSVKQMKDEATKLEGEIKKIGKTPGLKDLETLEKMQKRVTALQAAQKKKSTELEAQRKKVEAMPKEDVSAIQLKQRTDAEKRVEQASSEFDGFGKELKQREDQWEKILEAGQGAILKELGNEQAALKKRLSKDALEKNPLDEEDLEKYNSYMKQYGQIKSLGWLDKTDKAVHAELIKYRPLFKDLQGFENLGNTCWMNSALQALLGIKAVRERIEGDLEPRYTETEEAFQMRLKELGNAPTLRAAETDEAFAKRLEDFANKYPVKRSAKVETMLHNARVELHKRRSLKTEAPKLLKAETDAQFQERVKQYGVYVASKGAGQSARDYTKYLEDHEKRYLTKAKVKSPKSGAITFAPLPKETDAEFKARQEKYSADLERRKESDDEFETRKSVHDALKIWLSAWKDGNESMKDALEGVRQALMDSRLNDDFGPRSKGVQNCSASFVRTVMSVLDMPFFSVQTKKVGDKSQDMTPDPIYDLKIPLKGGNADALFSAPKREADAKSAAAKKSDADAKAAASEDEDDDDNLEADARDLILAYIAERQNPDLDNEWNNTSDYLTSYRLKTIPDVLPIHFHRRVTEAPASNPQIAEGVKKILRSVLPAVGQAIRVPKLSEKDERAKKAMSAFVDQLVEPVDSKIDRKVIFNDLELDLTDLFDEDIRGADPIIYRVTSFTVHMGGSSGGHYVAYRLCDDGKWRYYSDDSQLKVLEDEEDVKAALSQAYNVFLERVEAE